MDCHFARLLLLLLLLLLLHSQTPITTNKLPPPPPPPLLLLMQNVILFKLVICSPNTTLFNSMDPVQALKNLQGMGFCLAACERALRVSDNSLDRCAWHGLIWSGIIQGFKVMVSAVICARRALD